MATDAASHRPRANPVIPFLQQLGRDKGRDPKSQASQDRAGPAPIAPKVGLAVTQ